MFQHIGFTVVASSSSSTLVVCALLICGGFIVSRAVRSTVLCSSAWILQCSQCIGRSRIVATAMSLFRRQHGRPPYAPTHSLAWQLQPVGRSSYHNSLSLSTHIGFGAVAASGTAAFASLQRHHCSSGNKADRCMFKHNIAHNLGYWFSKNVHVQTHWFYSCRQRLGRCCGYRGSIVVSSAVRSIVACSCTSVLQLQSVSRPFS